MGERDRVTHVDVIVIAAMEEEIVPFLERATVVSDAVHWGNSIHRTVNIKGANVRLVQGGIGLVNAAGAATSALLGAGSPEHKEPAPLVISAGSAGGLGEQVRVGDVVVGTNHINADADARAFGYELGQVPGMPASYPVSALLRDVSTFVPPAQGLVTRVHHGLIVSSYAFVGHERAVLIKGQFEQVLATDMESSAIAQTAHAYQAPFLAIRGISDLCGPSADADFLSHVDDAAERSAEVALSIMDAWLASLSQRAQAPTTA